VLIGTLPAPITSAPLVILIYVVLILMVASALASVLLRNLLYSVGAFAASMVLVALLYLAIAPFLLFAIQLLLFTLVSAAFLIALLRQTTGIEQASVGPFSREWIVGAAVAAATLALVAVVVGATSWPVGICCSILIGLGPTLTSSYVVGLAVVVVVLASAALGAGLLMAAHTLASPRGGGARVRSSSRGDGERPRSSRA
jgi:NADH:ubiquinone oxidoreductase subunit 6 (subunit J)